MLLQPLGSCWASTSFLIVLPALLLLLFLSDIAVSWDCNFYHYCLVRLLINYHYDWPVSRQLFFSLEIEVDQYLSPVFLNHFNLCVPLGLWEVKLGKDVLYSIPVKELSPSMYSVPACILHPVTVSWIVSGASLNTLHLGSYLLC